MSERLTRILNLSKKTGDTVIVHDPSADHDMVLVPFDDYEELVLQDSASPTPGGDYDEYLLEEMSERELIDKINRDIAIWRSYQDINEREKQVALLEDQMTEDPLPDPFEEDFSHRSDWHRVGDLMGEGRLSVLREKVESDDSSDPIRTYVPIDDSPLTPAVSAEPGEPHLQAVPRETDDSSQVFENEEELPLDDNPVFFEEPST